MKQLVCEMCGSTDLIKQDGVFVCQTCGCKYSVEEAKKMMVEGTVQVEGTVKIDTSDKVNTYKQIAISAYNSGSKGEAYQYFLKVLEITPSDYECVFYKSMCQGWQANLMNMRANEVIGGVVEATKILYADEKKTVVEKADGTVWMAKEVFSWIGALSGLVVNHGNEYAHKLVSAAKEFHQQERMISELLQINIKLLSGTVYENCSNKGELEKLIGLICSAGNTTAGNLGQSFTIKTGSKWNSFWEKYDPIYEHVHPNYETEKSQEELKGAITELQDELALWKSNYAQKMEQEERERQELRRKQYWEEHSELKKEYEDKIASLDSELMPLLAKNHEYEERITEIKSELDNLFSEDSRETEIKRKQDDLREQRKRLGLFAITQKKQLQEQIDALNLQLEKVKNEIVQHRGAVRADVSARVSALEKEREPLVAQIHDLELEKERIKVELTKNR